MELDFKTKAPNNVCIYPIGGKLVMATFQYKTEEDHQRHLAWRREYYKKNRERIRQRDNANAKKNREQNPERYRKYVADYQKRQREKGKSTESTALPPLNFDAHPDKDLILAKIAEENQSKGGQS